MCLGLNINHILVQDLANLCVGLVFDDWNNWSRLHDHSHDNDVILMYIQILIYIYNILMLHYQVPNKMALLYL